MTGMAWGPLGAELGEQHDLKEGGKGSQSRETDEFSGVRGMSLSPSVGARNASLHTPERPKEEGGGSGTPVGSGG